MNGDSTKSLWAGRIVSGLLAAFLLVIGVINVIQLAPAAEGLVKYGYPAGVGLWLGIALFISAALYAIPRTVVLGAILLTGYLGGATATHVRAGEPFFFPIVFGVLVWGGLFLRDERIRSIIPLRKLS